VPGARDKTPHVKKTAFLAAYARTGNISKAAEDAGVDRKLHYQWLKNDPAYPDAFTEAHEKSVERMEAEADRRAVQGLQKVKTYQGEIIMVPSDLTDPESPKVPLIEHEYSDTLLIFRLKALKPEKYRDNASVDLTSGGKSFTLNIGTAKPTD
jgi:hypothetical protein